MQTALRFPSVKKAFSPILSAERRLNFVSKNVLILSGSPRKGGNSDLLCDEFMRGALDAGHSVEKLFISDLNIGYCKACYACRSGVCVLHDDMAMVLEKMHWADVLVLASPVYFYSIDAQMKAIIDRTLPQWTELKGKEMVYILTAAEDTETVMNGALACFRGLAECLPDSVEKGVLCGKGVYEKGDVRSTAYMADAFNMGLQL